MEGAKAGVAAIVVYHLVPGNFLPAAAATETPPPTVGADPAATAPPVQRHEMTVFHAQAPAPPVATAPAIPAETAAPAV